VARLADELFASAKAASTATERCEAYERLAALDATARHDTASALLWHRSVLEEIPDHTPSLRYIEHQLIGDGRSDELEPVLSAIARCLRGSGPGERTAHAEMAARLRMRDEAGGTTSAFEMIALAAAETDPSLWSLRMFEAHARTTGDDAALLDVCKRLVDRSTRSTESAALLLRAGEAAMRLDRHDEARALLQRATVEDSGDVVAWWLLAEVRRRAGDARAAAEACEALARCSGVRQHQLIAWFDAGRLWLDEVHDEERALVALEAAATIDVTHFDVFDRLSRLYASRRMQPELAELLERRLERVGDPDERRTIEVRRGRALLEAGEADGARRAFEAALKSRADDPDALSAFADLCIAQNDWNAAEQALVRLARLLPTAEEQRGVYARLGELYSHRLLNLSRAEVALKEVLRRAPDDVETTQKLVEVYKRQNDPARAVELQQELVDRAQSPEDRRDRVLELAAIHEKISRDVRRAEKTLESARRDLPHDVVLLRALAEFYTRHHQTPAVHMLLDRASADARRALGAGRIASPPFEILAAVAELRNKPAAALAASAMLAAVEGRPVEAHPGGARALSREFDELVAPETLTAGIRALFEKAGDALESAAPFDLREARATPLAPEDPVALFALRIAAATGLGGLQVFSSPRLGAVCLPVGAPPALVFGEALLTHENAAQFLALRAVKLVRAHAAALGRGTPSEVAVLVSAWLKAFVPAWQPQGITTTAMNSILPRVQAALPRTLDTDVPMLALEASAALDGRQATVGAAAVAWANRAALVALGDPAAALDAIAIASGLDRGAPTEPRERAAWIARTPEARDLVAFGVTDAYAELRARLES
jgi:predicted Zn-dependent protease